MYQEKYFPVTKYETNFKKVHELWRDFSSERAQCFHDLMMQQDKDDFKFYLWDRFQVNLSCKNIQSAEQLIRQQEEITYDGEDERASYIGGTILQSAIKGKKKKNKA